LQSIFKCIYIMKRSFFSIVCILYICGFVEARGWKFLFAADLSNADQTIRSTKEYEKFWFRNIKIKDI
jgi:hypothetical protein